MKKAIFLLLILWVGLGKVNAQHEMSIAAFDTTVWNSNRQAYNLLPDSFPIYFKQTSGALIDHFKWEIWGFSKVDTLIEYQIERPIFWVKYKKPLTGFGQANLSVRLTTTDLLLDQRMYQLNLSIYFYHVNILNPDTVYFNKGDSVQLQAKGTWGIGQMNWYRNGVNIAGPRLDSVFSIYAKSSGKYSVGYAKGFSNSPVMTDTVVVIERTKPKFRVCNLDKTICNSNFFVINDSTLNVYLEKESQDSIKQWTLFLEGVSEPVFNQSFLTDKISLRFQFRNNNSYNYKLIAKDVYDNSDTISFGVTIKNLKVSIIQGKSILIKRGATFELSAYSTEFGNLTWFRNQTKLLGPFVDSSTKLSILDTGLYIIQFQTNYGIFYDSCRAGYEFGNSLKMNLPNQVLIFPNPAVDFIEIQSNSNVEYKLFNMQGGLVKSGNEKVVSVQELPKGMYIIEYFNQSQVLFERIIIQ